MAEKDREIKNFLIREITILLHYVRTSLSLPASNIIPPMPHYIVSSRIILFFPIKHLPDNTENPLF
jgi:hypothetical protein